MKYEYEYDIWGGIKSVKPIEEPIEEPKPEPKKPSRKKNKED